MHMYSAYERNVQFTNTESTAQHSTAHNIISTYGDREYSDYGTRYAHRIESTAETVRQKMWNGAYRSLQRRRTIIVHKLNVE